jgi:hypothetical protein
MNQDFIRMPLNMTLRLGFCRIGPLFRGWLGITRLVLPESVNHNRPPAYRIKDIFERGHKRSYSKTRDATAILRGQDLMTAVTQCPELKAFVNTILRLSGATIIE